MSYKTIDALFADGILSKLAEDTADLIGRLAKHQVEVAIIVMPSGHPNLTRVGMNVDRFELVNMLEAALKVAKGEAT